MKYVLQGNKKLNLTNEQARKATKAGAIMLSKVNPSRTKKKVVVG